MTTLKYFLLFIKSYLKLDFFQTHLEEVFRNLKFLHKQKSAEKFSGKKRKQKLYEAV